MGSLSKSSGESQTQSKARQTVWGEQSPFLIDLYQRGADLLSNYRPHQGIRRDSREAWQNMLNPQMNPHLDAMTAQYTQALGQLDNQTGAAAAGAGVFGGGRQGVEQFLNQQNIGNQLGNFLGSQYQADMGRSMQALQMTPMVNQMTGRMQRLQMLNQIGGLMGDPTVLSRAKSTGSSSEDSFGFGVLAK